MQNLVCNSAIKDSTLNRLHSDLHSIDAIASNITGSIDQLAEVNLAVLDGDKTNKMSPGGHFKWYRAEQMKCSE